MAPHLIWSKQATDIDGAPKFYYADGLWHRWFVSYQYSSNSWEVYYSVHGLGDAKYVTVAFTKTAERGMALAEEVNAMQAEAPDAGPAAESTANKLLDKLLQ